MTKVANNNGAIIILTIFKNIIAKGDNFTENSGNKTPNITPSPKDPMINLVRILFFNYVTLNTNFIRIIIYPKYKKYYFFEGFDNFSSLSDSFKKAFPAFSYTSSGSLDISEE